MSDNTKRTHPLPFFKPSSTLTNTHHPSSTIRPSTLCLLLVLLSLSNQQRHRSPPLPPYPQFPTIPPSATPPANHSLRNWLFARFQSRKMRLAASTTKVWSKIPTLHLKASFSMNLTVDTSTPSMSQTPSMKNGTRNPAQSSPSTYSITPTIRMSLELQGRVTPGTPSQSTSVDKPGSTTR